MLVDYELLKSFEIHEICLHNDKKNKYKQLKELFN